MKPKLLRQLDGEIVETIHEDELEDEIESADTFGERIELAIVELDSVIRTIAEPASTEKRSVTSETELAGTRAADRLSSPSRVERLHATTPTLPGGHTAHVDGTSHHRHEHDASHASSECRDSP